MLGSGELRQILLDQFEVRGIVPAALPNLVEEQLASTGRKARRAGDRSDQPTVRAAAPTPPPRSNICSDIFLHLVVSPFEQDVGDLGRLAAVAPWLPFEPHEMKAIAHVGIAAAVVEIRAILERIDETA